MKIFEQIDKHIDEAIRLNKIIMITNSGSCSEMSAIYFAMAFIFTSGKMCLCWMT